MKGTYYIIAVIVIACLIFWRKSIVKKRQKAQKSIDTSSKAKSNFKKEELHKMSEANSSEETSSDKVPEVKEKEVYDGSRKKDRGKKRHQKKNTNSAIDEIEKKTEEVEKKTEVEVEKVTEEVKEKAEEVKEKVEAKAEEVKAETQTKVEDVKKEVKEEAKEVKEEVEVKAKEIKKETDVKADKIKEEVKEKVQDVKEEVKEEKLQIENKIASTGNYPDLIASIKNNPWTSDDLNTKVKFEDTMKKITLSEEEITDLPLDQIKASLSPESLADFLNITSTKPTILKRKEDTSYEFTTKDKEEVNLIKKRYGLLDREIDKITSILIFDKEGQKLKEVKDVLAEGKNRIYMETKF